MKRSFKSFLEATGDHQFDKMMGNMRARATATRDFGERIKGLADTLPAELNRQNKLEAWLESELKHIRMLPNRMLQRHAHELDAIADGYREDTSLLEMLYFHASSKDPYNRYIRRPDDDHEESLQDVADAFMHNHLEDVQDACTAWWVALEKLREEADKKDWPIKNWRRASKYDSERSHARSVIEFLQHWWKGKLREDVFASGDELKMAVNGPGKPKASSPGHISTNLPNRLRGTTVAGTPVYYAFSYVPDGESTKLLNSIKGKGPYKVDEVRRHKFLEETAAYIAKHLKDGKLVPDAITAPRSSSGLLKEFAYLLAKELGVQSVHLAAYHKKEHPKLPENRAAAMEYIKANFIDHAMLDAKYHGQERDAFENEIAKGLYYKLRDGGTLDAKKVHKPHAKFVKGYYDLGEIDDTLDGQTVLVVDDIQSTGSTMNDVFRIAKDLGAAKVFGAVIFNRTTAH